MSRGPRLLPDPVGLELLDAKAPPRWEDVFATAGPLELEIGCGLGAFALEYVRLHPEVRYVAIERRKKWARDVQHRADKRGLKNLRVIEADAKAEVPRLFAPATLAGIHLQFPDPWWKRAHQKRALLTPDFARTLWELVVPGGFFDLRTDVEDRAVRLLAALEGAGFHNPLGVGSFHPASPADVPSTREKRYLVSGEPVYRARLLKPAGTP
jgi:tRNA (guanine-N7-)-methyltransferase